MYPVCIDDGIEEYCADWFLSAFFIFDPLTLKFGNLKLLLFNYNCEKKNLELGEIFYSRLGKKKWNQ